ncbi:hypothetical protein [Gilvimarinus agarilyticus]|uniref:hypothetical protein n=1 Tax=Gilvimarinus agarilyticus TaxID=679259 RepID=UPI0005A26DD4|nr:hypothetical protein [Gilvimarinus agarilyticus]
MDFITAPEAEILAVATPIMDNLMSASGDIDHARHTRDFTDRLKQIVMPDYLRKVCEKYQAETGFFAKRELVAVFRRPDSVAIVWRQYFTKAPGEFVAEMVLVQQDGKYLCDHAALF